MCTYIHIYIYTYVYTHIYVYTHTHIHTHNIQVKKESLEAGMFYQIKWLKMQVFVLFVYNVENSNGMFEIQLLSLNFMREHRIRPKIHPQPPNLIVKHICF